MNIKRTEDTFVFRPKTNKDDDMKTSDFFIFTLRKTKKFQIYNASDELIDKIHELVIEVIERKGISFSRKLQQKVEYKLKFPSETSQRQKTIIIKFFVCKLLEKMKAHGWGILTGFDMSRGLSNKGELLFQRSPHLSHCKAFCLSPLSGSKLALINAPPSIVTACHNIITARWHQPLISQTQYKGITTCEIFELGGHPWGDYSDGAYFVHSMLCFMLNKFLHKGYRLVVTADVIQDSLEYDDGTSCPHDPNAWWFMHEPQEYDESALLASAPPWSEVEASPQMPSVSSVLVDNFREPPISDPLAHQEEKAAVGAQLSSGYNNENTFEEAPPSYQEPPPSYQEPPPSYEEAMGQHYG
ncbi:hypothetical protein QZH41_004551 [Actinostola sp. cb2023]|nr:hypothetical protein QZH41_004551 [Actinostola sp. cb2023]